MAENDSDHLTDTWLHKIAIGATPLLPEIIYLTHALDHKPELTTLLPIAAIESVRLITAVHAFRELQHFGQLNTVADHVILVAGIALHTLAGYIITHEAHQFPTEEPTN